jgi:flavin-dependent dehydrogenase
MTSVETIVVGGGPAGAAAACGLALRGREVLLVERSIAPHHKVCGEFLSVETQADLRRLGIEVAARGAVPIDEVVVHAGTKSAAAALPFRAMSLSRYRLDGTLLRRAAELGADVRRGVSVRRVTRRGGGWQADCGGLVLCCRNLVLATGKVGLRGVSDSRIAPMVGVKMHLATTPALRRALAGRVELFLFGRSYAGLELVEDGIANLCCLLAPAAAREMAADWSVLCAHLSTAQPQLAERLAGISPLWERPVAVACPAGGHMEASGSDAVFRVGDRLAHIPPFTGDGLAIALGSAALAAGHIAAGLSAADYARAARSLAGRPVRVAAALAWAGTRPLGRGGLMAAARHVPGLLRVAVRGTRLRPARSQAFARLACQ